MPMIEAAEGATMFLQNAQALELLRRLEVSMQAYSSIELILKVDYHESMSDSLFPSLRQEIDKLKFRRPNLVFLEGIRSDRQSENEDWSEPHSLLSRVLDGKYFWHVDESASEYTRELLKDSAMCRGVLNGMHPFQDLLDPAYSYYRHVLRMQDKGELLDLSYLGTEECDGRLDDVVTFTVSRTTRDNVVQPETYRLNISSEGFVRRLRHDYLVVGRLETALVSVESIDIDPVLEAGDFVIPSRKQMHEKAVLSCLRGG